MTSDDNDMQQHTERFQQQYLVWYEGSCGGCFSVDVGQTMKHAQWNRDLFIEDGYPARIIKLTVEDGQPVAQWVDGVDS